MRGDTHWTVEILLPYYTGENRWRSIYGGESEQLARRMVTAERRAGNRARLRRWLPEVVDADDAETISCRFCDAAIPGAGTFDRHANYYCDGCAADYHDEYGSELGFA